MILGVALAIAAPVTVVTSMGPGPGGGDIDEALAAAGLESAEVVDGAAFVGRLTVVSVTRRTADEDCGGTVDLGAWRTALGEARRKFQLLQFDAALADLVSLELQSACLTTIPAALDLFRLELTLADAHRLLAGQGDARQAAFHEAEVDAALRRAVALGDDLDPPAEVSPEVLEALARARVARRPADTHVLVAGSGARSGARFNGRPVGDAVLDVSPGPSLVQASVAGTVTAAATLDVHAGDAVLVWLAPGERGLAPADLVGDVDSLASGPPDALASAHLAAAARLAGDVVYAGRDGGRVVLWAPRDGRLDPLSTGAVGGPAGPAPDWNLAVGASAGGGYASEGGEMTSPGGRLLGGFYGRVGVAPRWSVAVSLAPDLGWEPLGERTLFRMTVPLRVGVRYGARERGWTPEFGLDAGAQYFGVVDGADRLSPVFTASGGASHGWGRRRGVRLEAFAGAGLGYATLGAAVGVEGRR